MIDHMDHPTIDRHLVEIQWLALKADLGHPVEEPMRVAARSACARICGIRPGAPRGLVEALIRRLRLRREALRGPHPGQVPALDLAIRCAETFLEGVPE